MGRHVAQVGGMRGACSILVGEPEGWGLLGGPGHGWEDNIKMDLVSGLEWGLVAGPCEYSGEPWGSVKGGEFLDWLSHCWLPEDSAPWSWLVTLIYLTAL